MAVPTRVRERFRAGVRRLIPVLKQQRARDVSEADTVSLVKEFLSEVLGYDPYADITGQYQVKGQFCDLAVKVGERLTHLVEVKAIGIALTEKHLLQVVTYAANEGVEWVVLTNGVNWQLFSVIFGKPIATRLVAAFDALSLDVAKPQDVETLYTFSKEGCRKGVHLARRARLEALDRHLLAALLLRNRRVVATLCRELGRLVKVRVEARELPRVLEAEVLKRDVLENPAFATALARVVGGKPVEPVPSSGPVILAPRRPERQETSLADLLNAHVLPAPLALFRTYKGEQLEARLLADGGVEFGGHRYESASKAACEARRSLTGRPMSTNGWDFWQYEAEGVTHTLADARAQFVAQRRTSVAQTARRPG